MNSLLAKFFRPSAIKLESATDTASKLAIIRANAASMAAELKESGYTHGVDYRCYVWQMNATDEQLLKVTNY